MATGFLGNVADGKACKKLRLKRGCSVSVSCYKATQKQCNIVAVDKKSGKINTGRGTENFRTAAREFQTFNTEPAPSALSYDQKVGFSFR